MHNVVTCHGSRDCEEPPILQLDVMLGYEVPPEAARELLLRVLNDERQVLGQPVPVVRMMALSDSGITYQLKFAIADPARRIPVQDTLYSQVWYAVQRAGYNFPYPHRQIVTTEANQPFQFPREQTTLFLRESELFALLDEATLAALVEQAPVLVYGTDEVVVRQGEAGSSLFVVLKGHLVVAIDGAVVGAIKHGSFFGEMSLLTGEPRSATVRAACEVWLAEITKETMEPILRANPAVLEGISAILAQREQSRARHATVSEQHPAAPRSEDYLKRLKYFFGL